MFDVHSPDRFHGFLVDGDEVVDNIGLEAPILIDDDLVQSIGHEILRNEHWFVVLDGEDADFCHEGGQIYVIFHSVDVEVGTREELWLLVSRTMPVQVIKSLKDDVGVFYIQLVQFWLVYLPLGVGKHLVRLSVISPLALSGVVNSPVTEARDHFSGRDEFGGSLVIELDIQLILIHDVTLLHFQ